MAFDVISNSIIFYVKSFLLFLLAPVIVFTAEWKQELRMLRLIDKPLLAVLEMASTQILNLTLIINK
jgi:hypothetical protein